MIKRLVTGAVFVCGALLALIVWQASPSVTASPDQPRAVPTVYCDSLSFSRADYNTGGAWPNSIAVGDFNADSVPDLAVANWESGTLSLLLGTGNGTFGAATPLPVGDYPTNVLTGTLRPGSRADLMTTFGGNYPTPPAVAVLLNNGSGVYGTPVYYAATNYPWCAATGDFNRDGKLDLAVGDGGSPAANIAVLLGNGDGTFAPAQSFPAGGNPWAMAAGLINGDDRLDLALANNLSNNVAILLGNGDGTFAAPRTISGIQAPGAVVLGDFNGDQKLDMALSVQVVNERDIVVLLGDGTGGFGTPVHYPAGSRPSHLTLGDFNGDGKLDLAAANTGSTDASILLGRGDGTFAAPANFPVAGYPTALAVADLNADGRMDLAAANSYVPGPGYSTSYTVSVLLNNCGAPAPSVTSTPCGVFSDVHPADYFYGPVGTLACRGVLSGYGDGTFRPYNNTTRAQQVKIVVLGFGLASPTPAAGGYTFADVQPDFPFFTVIETAAAHQIVSGYACGGPGEPCDARQRPYLRPYGTVTRGQLAKIVVAAAGWGVIDPPSSSFADVAPDTTFYPFVETAACHGIISGYSCGGPGEPCDPAGRPYFRPAHTATRGQIAKIVVTALSSPPSCAAGAPK